MRGSGDAIEAAIPGSMLSQTDGLFIGVVTRYRGISIDRTGLHFVQIEGSGAWEKEGVIYASATPVDLATCATLFSEAFKDSIEHHFGPKLPSKVVRQVFRLCYDAEAEALLVAMVDGKVLGYVFAPTSLRRVWRTAIGRGHLWRWIVAWVRGRLPLGWAPLRILLLDKFHFVRSSVGSDMTADARILSIAVAPDARSEGIGTQLVHHALQRFRHLGVRRVRLEVRPWNVAALKVYRKLGFRAVGTTRDTQGEWVIMLAEL